MLRNNTLLRGVIVTAAIARRPYIVGGTCVSASAASRENPIRHVRDGLAAVRTETTSVVRAGARRVRTRRDTTETLQTAAERARSSPDTPRHVHHWSSTRSTHVRARERHVTAAAAYLLLFLLHRTTRILYYAIPFCRTIFINGGNGRHVRLPLIAPNEYLYGYIVYMYMCTSIHDE